MIVKILLRNNRCFSSQINCFRRKEELVVGVEIFLSELVLINKIGPVQSIWYKSFVCLKYLQALLDMSLFLLRYFATFNWLVVKSCKIIAINLPLSISLILLALMNIPGSTR